MEDQILMRFAVSDDGSHALHLRPAGIPCINLETAHRDQSLRLGPR